MSTEIGSRVQFGSYPQSTDRPEPIEWWVLDIIDGKALLISENLLDAHRFDAESSNWQKSELRAWLNMDFLGKAFMAQERGRLSAYAGDKVTLLSTDEAEKYFSGSDDRKAKPTAYARKNEAYVNSDFGTGVWWLRSHGSSSGWAAYIHYNGNFCDFGNYVDDVNVCVRPVVLVSL